MDRLGGKLVFEHSADDSFDVIQLQGGEEHRTDPRDELTLDQRTIARLSAPTDLATPPANPLRTSQT